MAAAPAGAFAAMPLTPPGLLFSTPSEMSPNRFSSDHSTNPPSPTSSPCWIPNTEHLRCLPFVHALSLWDKEPLTPILVGAIIDEYCLQWEIDALSAAVAASSSSFVSTTSSVSKNPLERMTSVSTDVDRMVAKQYRKASLRVHPDRFGDMCRDDFNALKDAYETLKESDSRKEYVSKMFEVVQVVGTGSPLLMTAHNAWLKDRDRKLEHEASSHTRYSAATTTIAADGTKKGRNETEHKPYRIDAEVGQRRPGILHIHKHSGLHLWLGLQIHNLDAARHSSNTLQSISVVATPQGVPDETRTILTLSGRPLREAMDQTEQSKSNVVLVEVHVPDWGCWELSFCLTFESEGICGTIANTSTTPFTIPRSVSVLHPEMVKAAEDKAGLEGVARKETQGLQQAVFSWHSHPHGTVVDLEKRLWKLHQLISKAQWTSRQLQSCLDILDEERSNGIDIASANPVLQALTRAIREALDAKDGVGHLVEKMSKRDALKTFDQFLATVVERGAGGDNHSAESFAAHWIKTVSDEELVRQGGGKNRLFQLLVEGKRASSVFADPEMLRRASERDDLFTDRQREILLVRSKQVDSRMLEEQERLAKEQTAMEEQERERWEMERRAQIVDRGALVQLVNLKPHSELNGEPAYSMGVTLRSRYLVQLASNRQEITIKEENFVKYGVGGVDSTMPVPLSDSHCRGYTKSEPSLDANECDYSNDGFEQDEETRQENTGGHEDSVDKDVAPQPSPEREVSSPPVSALTADASASVLPTFPFLSRHEPKPPALISAFEQPTVAKVADSCYTPVATVLIHKHDVPKFLGGKGRNVKRLKQVSGVKSIRVLDDIEKTGGRLLVRIQLEGRPHSVHKAVQMTESSYEVFSVPDDKRVSPPGYSHPAHVSEAFQPVAVRSLFPSSKPSEPPFLDQSASGRAGKNAKRGFDPVSAGASSPHNFAAVKDELLDLCRRQAACIKESPESFCSWMRSQDIDSLQDLLEAMGDEDFRVEMQSNGLKGFKKAAFKKAVQSAVSGSVVCAPPASSAHRGGQRFPCSKGDAEGPRELYCPIYEGTAIEAWFGRHIEGQPIRPSMTDEALANLGLLPNIMLRNMAREYRENKSSS